jgi:hypothetical protein
VNRKITVALPFGRLCHDFDGSSSICLAIMVRGGVLWRMLPDLLSAPTDRGGVRAAALPRLGTGC